MPAEPHRGGRGHRDAVSPASISAKQPDLTPTRAIPIMRPSVNRAWLAELTGLSALRRHEFWLGFVVPASLAIATTYNYNVPVFETPDEIFHYLYVRNLAEGHGLPRDVGR